VALDLSGYKLTFEDEFNSFSRYTGAAGSGTWKTWFYFGDRTLNSNGERQYYMDPDFKGSASKALGVNPFSVQADPKQAGDGVLNIHGQPTDPAVKPYIWGYDYTSGLITTEPTFTQTYGYFEMRAKLPAGKGLWPAFWMLPADKSWPPELDPLEFFGGPSASGEGGVTKYHWGAIGGSGGWADVGIDVTQDYHTYGLKWQKDYLTYYFDGREIAKAATPASANKPMYMLANLAIGGNWPGRPDASFKGADMKVDYIRAYSNDPNAKPIGPTPTPTPTPAPTPTPTPTPTPSTGGSDVTTPTETKAPANTVANNSPLGTSANDFLNGNWGNTQTFQGGEGDDTYGVGDTGMKVLEKAGEGVDTVSAWLDYTLPANVENIVVGAPYAVKITGNAGANILAGNTGNDTLTGGAGKDLFVMAQGGGQDVITDFSIADDQVKLQGYNLADFNAVKAAMTQSGNNVVLALGNGDHLTFNNHKIADFKAANFVGMSGATPTPTPTPTPVPTPAPTPNPAGQSTIKLHVSEDGWKGDAQFQVFVDGKQVGGNHTVTASHRAGAWQDVVVTGDFGSAGPQKVEVKFVNDAWGGSASTDRNMYVDWVDVNGHRFEGENASFNSASLKTSATEAIMGSNGTLSFDTDGSSRNATPTPMPTPSTDPSGDVPVIGTLDATATPGGARTYVHTTGSTVNGTSGADDLYTNGAGQTLKGNGGNDIFHISSDIDAKIVVGTTGITEVSTWAPKYTLADGVDNLRAEGDYAHNLTGNAGHNWIAGGDANDTLNGGAGNDVLQVGTGANDLTGGSGKDMFVFADKADHDNVVHDFAVGADMIDLSGALKSAGYTGSNAVADHYISLVQAGADGTTIMIDPDGNGAGAAHKLVTIEHVLPSALKMGADVVWH
jgi:beta-glucanase (GH16 family)